VTYSRAGRLFEIVHSVAPSLYSRVLPPAFEAGKHSERAISPSAGAIFDPAQGDYAIAGGWKQHRKRELARALAAALRGSVRG